MKKFGVLVGSAALCLFGAVANATTLIDFDTDGGTQHSAGGPNGSYYEVGPYTLSPSNQTNTTQCFSGSCAQEFQGIVGTLKRTDNAAFDFVSFYFNLTGIGNSDDDDNYMDFTGFNGAAVVATVRVGLSDLLSSFLPNYDVDFVKDSTGASCKDDSNNPLDKTLYVCKNKGYTLGVLGGLFDGVTSVSWTASSTAQLRIDNIVVDSPNVVPLPAGAVLMLTALGGFGFARRRKA